jgi:SOS-response transcriptional repressor LexA
MIELQELTPRQERLMKFIGRYWQQNQIMPTFQDMMAGLDYTSMAPVQYLIKKLIEKGYLIRSNGARAIKIVHTIYNIPVIGVCT